MSYELIAEKIDQLAKAEKITKVVLGELSREILAYVIEEKDVRPINELLGNRKGEFVLTPINWRIACKYFEYFLPFTSNYEEVKECINKGGVRTDLVFKKLSPKKWDDRVMEINAWLADEENDLWVWSNSIGFEEPKVDYAGRITKNVRAAQEKGGLDAIAVMQAVLAAGIDPDVLVKAIAEAMPKDEDMEEAIAA